MKMNLKFFNKGAQGLLIICFLLLLSGQSLHSQTVERGRALYFANCIACHNKDPNKNGSLGPALIGTPKEVFLVKVPEGQTYPKGYTPKRKTKIMKKFPQLKNDVPSIYAWIQTQIKK